MDINQVKFGNYSIGNSTKGAKNNQKNKDENLSIQVENNNTKVSNPDGMMHALDVQGAQNKAQVNFSAKKDVKFDTEKYIDEARFNDIEAMMKEFENGVNNVADVIDAEFPNAFTDAQKMALAAAVFAQE